MTHPTHASVTHRRERPQSVDSHRQHASADVAPELFDAVAEHR